MAEPGRAAASGCWLFDIVETRSRLGSVPLLPVFFLQEQAASIARGGAPDLGRARAGTGSVPPGAWEPGKGRQSAPGPASPDLFRGGCAQGRSSRSPILFAESNANPLRMRRNALS